MLDRLCDDLLHLVLPDGLAFFALACVSTELRRRMDDTVAEQLWRRHLGGSFRTPRVPAPWREELLRLERFQWFVARTRGQRWHNAHFRDMWSRSM